jgi:hypothetical protein
MTYITSRGHVSVPEDLWSDILASLGRLASANKFLIESEGPRCTPDEAMLLLTVQALDGQTLQRARELDARHREALYEAGRSTREQIERGGGGQPYN